MPLTKDELIDKLKSAGVEFKSHDHSAVMTVEAQVQALPGNPGTVLKNLFLKDKKHRCYIVTALPDTKVDLQVLSARLGTGKGGIRMAPEELLQAVLQVPLGSVTPLAVANPEASKVVLLLDQKIREQAVVYVHPLVNTTSLELTPSALEAALRCVGREPVFVDLEAEPKIDRDHPPDLKAISDAAEAPAAALPQAEGADAAADVPAKAAAPAKDAPKKPTAPAADSKKGGDKKTAAAAAPAAGSTTDIGVRAEAVLAALLGAPLSEVAASSTMDAYKLAQLRADVEMHLNGLKNAAYAAGYMAGKGEMVAHAERRFA